MLKPYTTPTPVPAAPCPMSSHSLPNFLNLAYRKVQFAFLFAWERRSYISDDVSYVHVADLRVGWLAASVTVCVCLSALKKKTWAISTKLGACIVHGKH